MAIWEPLKETLISVLPVVIFLLAFNALILRRPLANPREIFSGLILTIIGLTIFIQGLNKGLLPLGTTVGENLTAFGNPWVILVFSFILGYGMTLAEPSLQALGMQVEEFSAGQITKTLVVQLVALGVGVGLVIGMLKVIMGWPYIYVIIPLYLLAIALALLFRTLVGLAFDSDPLPLGPSPSRLSWLLGQPLPQPLEGGIH